MRSSGTVRTSVPELRRLAPDALRMAGLPLGQSDESADLLVWTEIVTGGALRFLRLNRPRILSSPRPMPAVTHTAPGIAHVDAHGGSLLEHGIRIVDFARGEAAVNSGATVTVSHTYGSLFLPYFAWRCDQYGYTTSFTALDSTGAAMPPDPAERRVDVRMDVSPPDEPTNRRPQLSDPTTAPEPYRRAVDEGLDVNEGDFASFNELFEMLRVPTSERSRTHAG